MCTLLIEHVHGFSWLCAFLQLIMTLCPIALALWGFHWACTCFMVSISILFVENLPASRWGHACFQVGICTLSGEHVHASSWAFICFQMSVCMLRDLWACSRFQLSICQLPVEYKFVCFQLSMCILSVKHLHTSSWHVHAPCWVCAL